MLPYHQIVNYYQLIDCCMLEHGSDSAVSGSGGYSIIRILYATLYHHIQQKRLFENPVHALGPTYCMEICCTLVYIFLLKHLSHAIVEPRPGFITLEWKISSLFLQPGHCTVHTRMDTDTIAHYSGTSSPERRANAWWCPR
jgi:hypothetical protein